LESTRRPRFKPNKESPPKEPIKTHTKKTKETPAAASETNHSVPKKQKSPPKVVRGEQKISHPQQVKKAQSKPSGREKPKDSPISGSKGNNPTSGDKDPWTRVKKAGKPKL